MNTFRRDTARGNLPEITKKDIEWKLLALYAQKILDHYKQPLVITVEIDFINQVKTQML